MEDGGKDWQDYNKRFCDELLKGQQPNRAWASPVELDSMFTNKSGNSYIGDRVYPRHYRTCLATLSLEFYYRFLPGTGKAQTAK